MQKLATADVPKLDCSIVSSNKDFIQVRRHVGDVTREDRQVGISSRNIRDQRCVMFISRSLPYLYTPLTTTDDPRSEDQQSGNWPGSIGRGF